MIDKWRADDLRSFEEMKARELKMAELISELQVQ